MHWELSSGRGRDNVAPIPPHLCRCSCIKSRLYSKLYRFHSEKETLSTTARFGICLEKQYSTLFGINDWRQLCIATRFNYHNFLPTFPCLQIISKFYYCTGKVWTKSNAWQFFEHFWYYIIVCTRSNSNIKLKWLFHPETMFQFSA